MNLSGILPFLGTATLTGIAAALGTLAFQTTPAAPDIVPTQTTDPVPQTTAQQNQTLPSARPDVFYAAITERPLFAPTRRPVDNATPAAVVTQAPEPAVTAPVLTPPTDLKLSGILGGGTNRSAFVAREDGSGEWLRVDTKIEGWTITEIGPEWIVLSAGDDTFRLELFK